MTDNQHLKNTAKDKYEKQGKYEVIYTNYLVDMFKQYDALIARGYTRASDSFITATNINLAVQQVIHMEKPAKQQALELKAIYAAIDADNKTS